MTTKDEIEATLKDYLRALYTRDFDRMYELLYEDDIATFRATMVEYAYKMDEFGESDDFLRMLKIKDLKTLKKLSLKEFMTAILGMAARKIGDEFLDKTINGTTITNIEEIEYMSIVSYEFPVQIFGEWDMFKGQIEMLKTQGEWKLLFKSGLEAGMSRFHDEIEDYFRRKSHDKLENFTFEGDLTRFSLYGYRDFSNGKVVFEPRFKDAGDFSDGLAYVKIMTKYGYINTKGEIAIKPQFNDAKDFSQKLAAVKVYIDDETERWGFINRKGKMKIEPQFDETSVFSEGLCAVKKDEKWGFINKKGEVVIPFKFDVANDFSYGSAYVDMYNEDGDLIEFVLDKDGNIQELD